MAHSLAQRIPRRRLRIALLGVLLAVSADAQTPDEHRLRCSSENPEVSIAGCTALIRSGQKSGDDLALAFLNRGLAHAEKGEFDWAIKDYDEAIRLDPANATALYARGVTKRIDGDIAGGEADIFAATGIQAGIAAKMAEYGIRPQ